MRKKINWDWGIDFKDLIARSVKTFFQSAIAVAIASETSIVEIDTLRTASIAGIAAMLSLVNNVLLQSNKKLG
jgi:hypothetical protein